MANYARLFFVNLNEDNAQKEIDRCESHRSTLKIPKKTTLSQKNKRVSSKTGKRVKTRRKYPQYQIDLIMCGVIPTDITNMTFSNIRHKNKKIGNIPIILFGKIVKESILSDSMRAELRSYIGKG